jgi:diaminopimelate epimerase
MSVPECKDPQKNLPLIEKRMRKGIQQNFSEISISNSGGHRVSFVKAQALGNDFVILEQTEQTSNLTPDQISRLAHRRYGIGCDQVILFSPPSPLLLNSDEYQTSPVIDVSFYNQDGSKAQACGNGSRALAHYFFEHYSCDSPLTLRTKGGSLIAEKTKQNISSSKDFSEIGGFNRGGEISILLPEPNIKPCDDLKDLPPMIGQIEAYQLVDVGNLHLICFVEDLSKIDILVQGPLLEHHSLFQGRRFQEKGVNVSFANLIDRHLIHLKVWERGAGFTGACGTAACAAMASAFLLGKTAPQVQVHQTGGNLMISWKKGEFTLQGPAEIVYWGEIILPLS